MHENSKWKYQVEFNLIYSSLINQIKTHYYDAIVGCGFCKRLKPDFAAAATEMKGEAVSFLNDKVTMI